MAVDRRLDVLFASIFFEFPSVATFVVQKAGVVVAFVEVLEDGGKDLGELFRKIDSFRARLEELASTDGGEERGVREDIFVGGEETLFGTDADGDNGRGESADHVQISAIEEGRLERQAITCRQADCGLVSWVSRPSSSQQQHGLEMTSSACCS